MQKLSREPQALGVRDLDGAMKFVKKAILLFWISLFSQFNIYIAYIYIYIYIYMDIEIYSCIYIYIYR